MAHSQTTLATEKIERAWASWLENQAIDASSLAVAKDSDVILATGKKTNPNDRVPVASLSKAITAICLIGLIDEFGLSLGESVQDLLGGAFSIRPENQAITLQQLLTHSSGIIEDSTQARGAIGLSIRQDRTTAAALTRKNSVDSQDYRYNNENYAILGSIIETVSTATYAEYCAQKVLDPAGVEAKQLTGPWSQAGAFGGWNLSAVEYLRFVAHYFQTANPTPLRALPSIELNDRTRSTGSFLVAELEAGKIYFGHGLLCNWRGGFGAFFVALPNGTSIVVTYRACLNDQALVDLERALINAALGEQN